MPELFDGVAIAVGIGTSDADTKDPTIDGLSGSLSSSDGIVLGHREAGDAASGITIPTFAGDFTEKPDVAASYSKTAAIFKKVLTEGFTVSWLVQGNGATVSATPAAGECKPLKGLDALIEAAGLDGANGTAPVYEYTPRSSIQYVTIKMWVGDQAVVFTGCLVDQLVLEFLPGGNVIATATISVNKLDTADVDDGITFPTLDFTTQESMAAPVVAGVDMTGFGETRGANTLTLTITNSFEEIGDTAVEVTGMRKAQTERTIEIDAVFYSMSAESDTEWLNLIDSNAPTEDLSFQVGTVAGGNDTANAFKVECNNLDVRSMKYNKLGDQLCVEFNGRSTTTSGAGAGTEFKLTFN